MFRVSFNLLSHLQQMHAMYPMKFTDMKSKIYLKKCYIGIKIVVYNLCHLSPLICVPRVVCRPVWCSPSYVTTPSATG